MANDIFVSYARIDDSDNAVRKLVEHLKTSIKQAGGRREVITFFMDFMDIEIGEIWLRRIENEVRDCKLMLAFLSPSYFTSKYCNTEWDLFFVKKSKTPTNIIIPIEIEPLKDEKTGFDIRNKLEGEEMMRLEQALSLHTRNWYKAKHDEDKAETFLKDVGRFIDTRLGKPSGERRENTHVIERAIDDCAKPSSDERTRQARWDKVLKKIQGRKMKYQLEPVCVIYTGGTVGMIEAKEDSNAVFDLGDVDELKLYLHKLSALKIDIDFYSYNAPIDSSNICSQDWTTLAIIIKKLYKYYQGFVVLHGTNTMAYTASALSFMLENLKKPVVLTGAEIPLVALLISDIVPSRLTTVIPPGFQKET